VVPDRIAVKSPNTKGYQWVRRQGGGHDGHRNGRHQRLRRNRSSGNRRGGGNVSASISGVSGRRRDCRSDGSQHARVYRTGISVTLSRAVPPVPSIFWFGYSLLGVSVIGGELALRINRRLRPEIDTSGIAVGSDFVLAYQIRVAKVFDWLASQFVPHDRHRCRSHPIGRMN
jgi:hypothetical protein